MNPATRHPIEDLCRCALSFSFLAIAACLSGCSGVSVKGTWQDGAPRNQSYARLLVIGVGADRDVRCQFEAEFAEQLKSASTTAIPSCQYMSAKDALTRENVERIAASVNADAVVASRLISLGVAGGEGNSDDTRGSSVYKATDFAYGAYGMPVTEVAFDTAPPLTSLKESLHVVTKLYATQGAKLIYTIDTITKSQEIDSTQDTLMGIAVPTAARLRRAGLIR